MHIEVDNAKRIIVCYSSGEVPNITQNYYLVNFPENCLEEVLNDIDNMVAHIIQQQTGTASRMPYCDRPMKEFTEAKKELQKEEIKREIDILLDKLKSLE